jgi:two-component system phosphate regulon response regulator PhoB
MSFPTRHVLVADDEVDVLNLVSQNLTAAGFAVTKAADGLEALEKVRRTQPALVVLDLNMPKMTGTDVLRALKSDERTAGVAVVMLTACKDDVDRIVSLELGADDYVTKPFSPRELTLRIKSILSRRGAPAPTVSMAMVGNITLNREAHEVKVRNRAADLTAVEYKLLVALFSHPGRVFSREELLNAVWGQDSEIELRTVDTHLRRLREKLGSAARQILTIRGFGYRLDAA